jgi:radical SAM superfamily enzyme YgiQ (UPF0313 family)
MTQSSIAGKKKIVLYHPRDDELSKPVWAPMALLSLCRFLAKKNYDIRIIAQNLFENYENEVLRQCSDSLCFGITVMTGYQIKDALSIARKVREKYPSLPIVWGGWHPSILPQQTMENPLVDVIVRGQGEIAFTELIESLREKKSLAGIKGISFKKNGRIIHNPERSFSDVKEFPELPFHLVDFSKCFFSSDIGLKTTGYVSSFGCPYRCGFCCEQSVNKRHWSAFPAERVIKELEKLESLGADSVIINDSNFFVDLKRVKEICRGIINRKLKIKWGNVNGRTKQLNEADEELWELLKKSGCYSILTGAESGNQEMLEFIKKDISVRDTLEFAEKCSKYGIKIYFSMLMGLPWSHDRKECEKKIHEEFRENINLMDKIISLDSRNRIVMFIYGPYPGSPLYEKSLQIGFKPPSSFEGWGDFNLKFSHTPWIPEKYNLLAPMLTDYVLMLLCSDSKRVIYKGLNNRIAKFGFISTYWIFKGIAKARWKFKYFGLPVDYWVFNKLREKAGV